MRGSSTRGDPSTDILREIAKNQFSIIDALEYYRFK